MSYTDKTVYDLRRCLDEYTAIAVEVRDEEEINKDLIRLANKHKIVTKKQGNAVPGKFQGDVKKIKDVDLKMKFSKVLGRCIIEYVNKKMQLQMYQKENRLLARKLTGKGIELPAYLQQNEYIKLNE